MAAPQPTIPQPHPQAPPIAQPMFSQPQLITATPPLSYATPPQVTPPVNQLALYQPPSSQFQLPGYGQVIHVYTCTLLII